MYELSIPFPRLAVTELVNLYISDETMEGSSVQLRIVAKQSNISVRDFAAYLSFY